MQQRISLCSTADGARIAYATVGTGPALVVAEPRFSHLGLEWEEPRVRDFWQTLGNHHTVVRYDTQGCGFSDSEAERLFGRLRGSTHRSYRQRP